MNLITDSEPYRLDDKSDTQENREKNEEDIQDNEVKQLFNNICSVCFIFEN